LVAGNREAQARQAALQDAAALAQAATALERQHEALARALAADFAASYASSPAAPRPQGVARDQAADQVIVQGCVLTKQRLESLESRDDRLATALAYEGLAAREAADIEKTQVCLNAALGLLPDPSSPYYNYVADKEVAWALGLVGRHAEAVPLFERALGKVPRSDAAWVYLRLAESQIALGEIAAAKQSVDKAVAADPNDYLAQQRAPILAQIDAATQ
jgi:tetratricopeptide (TPR) repeat protein